MSQQQAEPGRALSESLLGRVSKRYGIDPTKIMGILRDSVFRVKKDEPPFTDAEVATALILADKYGLDPFAKEIYLARSKGRVVTIVGVDGWCRIINGQASHDGMEFDYEDSDGKPLSCTCRIYTRGRSHPTEITEYYSECRRDTEQWAQSPRRLLRHRALIQCARVAYGIGGIEHDDEVLDSPGGSALSIVEQSKAAAIAPPSGMRFEELWGKAATADEQAAPLPRPTRTTRRTPTETRAVESDAAAARATKDVQATRWRELRGKLSEDQLKELSTVVPVQDSLGGEAGLTLEQLDYLIDAAGAMLAPTEGGTHER